MLQLLYAVNIFKNERSGTTLLQQTKFESRTVKIFHHIGHSSSSQIVQQISYSASTLKKKKIIIFIYLKVGERELVSIHWFTHRLLQQAGMGQVKARRQHFTQISLIGSRDSGTSRPCAESQIRGTASGTRAVSI